MTSTSTASAYDVVVGDDVPVRRDDDPGALPVLAARRHVFEHAERQPLIGEGLIVHHHRRGDADDGGKHLGRGGPHLGLQITGRADLRQTRGKQIRSRGRTIQPAAQQGARDC
jgi:hypothetical protein